MTASTPGQAAYEAFMAHRDCPHSPAPWDGMAPERQRQWEAAAAAILDQAARASFGQQTSNG